jgi:glucose-1-phosphatase
MIKCIIFDFGSVFIKTDWENANEEFKEKEGFSAHFRGNKEIEEIYDKVNTGKDELKTIMIKLAPHKKDIENTLKSYKQYYLKYRTKNVELFSLLEKLKKKYTLYCYTDTIREHYEANKENGFFKDFEKVFTSFELGRRKQYPDAFFELLKILPFQAKECVFIDDHPINIENAKKAGFNVIYYTEFPDITKIKKELKEFGVNF